MKIIKNLNVIMIFVVVCFFVFDLYKHSYRGLIIDVFFFVYFVIMSIVEYNYE